MTLPSFFIGGAPKCGTTSLANALARHPRVFIPPQKELSFFHCDSYHQGLDAYARYFDEARSDQTAGEATPDYLASDVAAERIRECLPRSRHVFVVREPVERALSHYWFRWNSGRETRALERVIDDELASPGALRAGYVLKHGLYSEQIARYRALFGHDHVQVLLFEELIARPDAALRAVCEFLGVPPVLEALPKDNAARAPRSLTVARGLSAFTKSDGALKQVLRELVPAGARRTIRRRLQDVLSRPTRRPVADPALAARLTQFYAADVAALREQMDLTAWGRDGRSDDR